MPRVGVRTCVGIHTLVRRFVSSFLKLCVDPGGQLVGSLLVTPKLPNKVVKDLVTSLRAGLRSVGGCGTGRGLPFVARSRLLVGLFGRITCM